MAAKPTLDYIESAEDYEFHNEGILLISKSRTCFGDDLRSFVKDVISGIPGYDDYFDFSPHRNGYHLLTDATRNDKIIALENSVWLIEASCFFEEEVDRNLRSMIELSVPLQASIIAWHDSDSSSYSETEIDDLADFSNKVRLVNSERRLQNAIEDYFRGPCNPRLSDHCVRWNNRARESQRKIQ